MGCTDPEQTLVERPIYAECPLVTVYIVQSTHTLPTHTSTPDCIATGSSNRLHMQHLGHQRGDLTIA